VVGDQHQHNLLVFQHFIKVAELGSWCLMLANVQQKTLSLRWVCSNNNIIIPRNKL
jgi:hypothetical protein